MKVNKTVLFLIISIFFVGTVEGQSLILFKSRRPIQPWSKNPSFWEYKGEPLILLGGSNDDNLFQWPEEILIPHLDSMKLVGANYVRNTLSDRKDMGFELYPFKQLESGRYDLNEWNDEYWKRFETFLKETAKRDIIVQIELWDRFDYSQKNWPPHPYNPDNNINYSKEESGFSDNYPDHAGSNKQPFFFTSPLQRNNESVFNFQKKFIDKVLSYTLKHRHVLYCIDNETSGDENWSSFWADYIQSVADKKNKKICVTEMWDNWDMRTDIHRRTFDHPEKYQFCEVSQNTHQKGEAVWTNFQWVRNYIREKPRPINIVKTYGADTGRYGNSKDAVHRWWMHLIGGAASTRFHRPNSGLGLNELAVASISAARKIESVVKFYEMEADNSLLLDRAEHEAYLACKPGEAYVIFFPNGGDVRLNVDLGNSDFEIRWMDISTGEWQTEPQLFNLGNSTRITTPDKKAWVAVLKRA